MFILIATTELELFIWYLAIVINLIGTLYDFNKFILFSCKMKVSLPKKTLNQKSGDNNNNNILLLITINIGCNPINY